KDPHRRNVAVGQHGGGGAGGGACLALLGDGEHGSLAPQGQQGFFHGLGAGETLDPQANATSGMGLDKNALRHTLYEGLLGEAAGQSLVHDSAIPALKVIPTNVELIGFEVEMMAAADREKCLRRLIAPLRPQFDYIILDCPPSLSLLTLNALTAADSLIIPLQCEFYALEGLGQLLQTVKRVKRALNPGLEITGILLTMFDRRTNLAHQVAAEAEKHFKDLVFKTTIPRNIRLGEAPSFGKPIILYDATSQGAQSYIELAREIMTPTFETSAASA
ncbi:MAG: AAA family ATPase, partial [Desulfobacterales bacterium]